MDKETFSEIIIHTLGDNKITVRPNFNKFDTLTAIDFAISSNNNSYEDIDLLAIIGGQKRQADEKTTLSDKFSSEIIKYMGSRGFDDWKNSTLTDPIKNKIKETILSLL